MNNEHLDWKEEREDSTIQARAAVAASSSEKSSSRLSLVQLTTRGNASGNEVLRPQSELAEELNDDALRAYLAEVATFGTQQRITVRRSPNAAQEAVKRLPELYLQLIERRLFDAEITYVLSGSEWRATLTAERDRTRLERECLGTAPKKATAAGDSSPPAP